MSNASDFVIENGVLKKHTGTDAEVVIPDGVTSIEAEVFYCCENLKSVTIPENMTHIGYNAFWKCPNLTEVTISARVSIIYGGAFKDCPKLKSVHLPEGLCKIDSDAFAQCKSLEEINIPSSVDEIGFNAFNGCNLLPNMELPNTITELKGGVFAGCKNLRSVKLPDHLTAIGAACFGKCESLEKVAIPATVKTIGDHAFGSCKALKEIVLPEGLESVGEKTFAGCDKALRLYCTGKIFGMFDKETKDNLAKNWLNGSAEYGKDQSEAIKKYIARSKKRLFTEIEGDDEVTIANLLDCGKVNPEILESFIMKCNDGNHPKMTAVLLDFQNRTISSEKKEEIIDKALGLKEMTANDWKKIYRWAEEPDGIVITKYKGIDESVEIPARIDEKPVIKIGKNAFKGNSQVHRVSIPDSVTEIQEKAFEGCVSLSELQWSENLCTIEKRAFFGCTMLTGTLDLPHKLKSIGASAFVGCAFTQINLPEGLENIADYSLSCDRYAQLHIPASVKNMGCCTGYFTGDLFIHGMKTKLKSSFYTEMPLTVHAPAGSFAAKCADKGDINSFQIL